MLKAAFGLVGTALVFHADVIGVPMNRQDAGAAPPEEEG